MATPEIPGRIKVVHRAALAFGAAGNFTVILGHHLVHPHANSERMPVVAIGCDNMVIFAHDRGATHRDGFLPNIQVKKPTNFALLIAPQAAFFKTANPDHVSVEGDLLVLAELNIDGRLTRIIAQVGDFWFFRGGRLLGHRECFKFEVIIGREYPVVQGYLIKDKRNLRLK